LLSVETIVGNALVLIAYRVERSISKQVGILHAIPILHDFWISNRYIVSLALSDLIIGLEGIPLFTIYVINGDR
jgi:hypothetical protein